MNWEIFGIVVITTIVAVLIAVTIAAMVALAGGQPC